MKRDELDQRVRDRLRRYPAPHASHYGVVPLPPPIGPVALHKVGEQHRKASDAIIRLDALSSALGDPFYISRILARGEALSSSRIEGTHSTLDELLSVEEGETEAGASTLQVRDYALALEHWLPQARALKHQVFTIDTLRALHRAAMMGDLSYQDKPGEFRTIVAWIGGGKDLAYSIYNPAPPDEIEICLNDTIAYLRAERTLELDQSLITRMAISHAHLEAVHPFRDGNGRAGRLLLPLMMAAEDHVPLYLSPYIEANKPAYYRALKLAQQKLHWQDLIGFISDAILGTVDELANTREAFAKLNAIWRARRQFRAASAAERALALLPHYPILTASRLSRLLGVTFRAADKGIQQLVEVGILIERTGYARNRIFAAPEILSVINRPFGADPELPQA